MAVDIIGDVHGQAERLEALLAELGYRKRGGAWRHPSRTAVFVGDLIDRGPGQVHTLELVRDMVEAGAAEACLGNHEFNAIAFATRDPAAPEQHLRVRHGAKGEKNRRQHAAFLEDVGLDSREHQGWIDWFLKRPLWLQSSTFQVVHACWSPEHVARLRAATGDEARLSLAQVIAASRPADPLFEAVEILLKGEEIPLPPGHAFSDKDGHVRSHIRTRWWDPAADSYASAYIGPSGVEMPDLPLPPGPRPASPDRPTFIGHYWLDPAHPPAPLAPLVACVDYSVGNGGRLAAYRFDGEPKLLARKFVAV